MEGMKWVDFGIQEMDEGLGIKVAKEKDVAKQWEEKLTKVREACRTRMGHLEATLSTTAKVQLVQGAYASKVVYTQEVQAPKNAENSS